MKHAALSVLLWVGSRGMPQRLIVPKTNGILLMRSESNAVPNPDFIGAPGDSGG